MHIDDSDWISALRRVLAAEGERLQQSPDSDMLQRQLLMAHFSLWGHDMTAESLAASLERLHSNPVMLGELLELLQLRQEMIPAVTPAADLPFPCPLRLHAGYTRYELFAALGHWTLREQPQMREGVLHLRKLDADLFLITLNKTEREYSPTTMYEDYAIIDRLFHWQSQSTTSAESPTGQRYINHRDRGHTILLAVRENNSEKGLSCPYYFLGAADYVSHEGSRPMSIIWRLHRPIPAHLLRVTERLAVG